MTMLSPIHCATGMALFILTVCTPIAVSGGSVEDTVYVDVGVDDVTFTGNLLFTANSVRSKVECGQRCKRDAACKSFTYSPSVKGCTMYSVSLNAGSPKVPAPNPCKTYSVYSDIYIPNTNPCHNYTLWNDHTRSVTYGDVQHVCDSGMAFAWYRFQINGSDAVVPNACGGPTWIDICDCDAPMWLDFQGAALPAVGEEISVVGCANWSGGCCHWTSAGTWTPLVHNCGAFYVFKLQMVGGCTLRWCAQLGTY